MPHPVPIIIGTAIAAVGSAYAFKKFVYDPHVAPFIDALIAAHRSNNGYERVPVPVAQVSHPAGPPAYSGGRSTAVDVDGSPTLRRRRPAEVYELDEGAVLAAERVERVAFTRPDIPVTYAVRQRSRVVTPLSSSVATITPNELINMDYSAPVQHIPPPPPAASVPLAHPVPLRSALVPRYPDGPEPALPPPYVASRPSSRATVVVSPFSSSAASPAVTPSQLSSGFSSPVVSAVGDDAEIVSLSGVSTTSYVDAEAYTPRSALSPSTPLSRTISPLPLESTIELVVPDVTAMGMTFLADRPDSRVLAPRSVSSWGDDEHWRAGASDSEWDALSDAGAM
ncbi:hypothetical protein Q8F55_007938 [Vanrija albida]|uniref:Transmembrane protein n=1 Tax=Vanrija albida TaxID=181172 RepID=A0ABR3PUW0_9TREE